MNLTSPPAVLTPSSGAVHDEPALWSHSLQTFLREMDALVAIGRIDHDARNVILCALKRAIPMVDRTGEDLRP
jgi:hypothetical protein